MALLAERVPRTPSCRCSSCCRPVAYLWRCAAAGLSGYLCHRALFASVPLFLSDSSPLFPIVQLLPGCLHPAYVHSHVSYTTRLLCVGGRQRDSLKKCQRRPLEFANLLGAILPKHHSQTILKLIASTIYLVAHHTPGCISSQDSRLLLTESGLWLHRTNRKSTSLL